MKNALDKHDESRGISLPERIRRYERALNADEVASFFNLQADMIRKRARDGSIPSFRVGSAVRFDPKKIADWLEKQ
jgi:excisionase family DNA binding protein